MFEGHAIPSPHVMEVAIPWMAIVWMWILTLAMRHLFSREWQLTHYALWKPRLLWGRQMGESSNTAGQLVSHLMGLMPFGITTWLLQQSGKLHQLGFAKPVTPEVTGMALDSGSTAWWLGIGLGGLALLIRSLMGLIGGWVTERPEVTRMQLETDRYMRNHFSGIVSLLILVGIVQAQGAFSVTWLLQWIGGAWGIWLIWKWLRFLQLIQIQSVPFGWGIAYLCTMEIVPSGVLFFSALSAGI